MHHGRMLAVLIGILVGTWTASSRADTIIVTTDSGGTGGPDCTLRDAITAANTDTATGGCPAGYGADTIELPIAATITLIEVDNDLEAPTGHWMRLSRPFFSNR